MATPDRRFAIVLAPSTTRSRQLALQGAGSDSTYYSIRSGTPSNRGVQSRKEITFGGFGYPTLMLHNNSPNKSQNCDEQNDRSANDGLFPMRMKHLNGEIGENDPCGESIQLAAVLGLRNLD